jgi:hypothetical protein
VKQALFKNDGIDEKTLRALIVAGSVKALCSVVNGPLFHVEVLLASNWCWQPLPGKIITLLTVPVSGWESTLILCCGILVREWPPRENG